MKPVRPSRTAAETRYRDIRLAALRRTEEIVATLLAPVPVALTGIGQSALDAFQEQWVEHPRRRHAWPWSEMVRDGRRNAPDRFEVAVWSGQTLCGLAIGPTRPAFCRVDDLEGAPVADHPLKGHVFAVVSGAVVAYAKALGKSEVRLDNPLKAVVPLYENYGFTLAEPPSEAPYCWWKVI